MSSCLSKNHNNMGPPQKTGTYYCTATAVTQQLTKPEALSKGIVQTLCKSHPCADGTRLSKGKAGAGESIQAWSRKAMDQGRIGQWQNHALVQAFCFQDNTLPIKHANIHTIGSSITFQSRQIQMWFKCTFLILSVGV